MDHNTPGEQQMKPRRIGLREVLSTRYTPYILGLTMLFGLLILMGLLPPFVIAAIGMGLGFALAYTILTEKDDLSEIKGDEIEQG